MTGSDSI